MNDLPKANPCKYCGGKPKIAVAAGEIFYVQCKCGKWSPYEFCAANRKGAINNWNTYNTKRGETCQ